MDGLGEGFVSGNANATRNAFLGGPVGSSDTVLVSVERLSIVRQPQGFLRRGDKLFANLDRVKSLLNPGPGLFRRVPLPSRVTELGSDGVKVGTVPLYKGTRVDGMRSTEAFARGQTNFARFYLLADPPRALGAWFASPIARIRS